MSTTDHLRAAGHHAKMAGQWKRAEAGDKLARKAFDEHATAVAMGRMGAPASAHAHEARAHLAGAAADAVAPGLPPPLVPHSPPVVHHHVHSPARVVDIVEEGSPVHVLPPRVIEEIPPSPATPPLVVAERVESPLVFSSPPPVVAPPPTGPYPFVPRPHRRHALREFVNAAKIEGRRKLGEGADFMARKAGEEHYMAVNSSALGLPGKAHKHESRAQMAGAVASLIGRHGIPPHGPMVHPPGVPPVVVEPESPTIMAPIMGSPR